ncbi:Retrovirus-related Pol polyprotein from transposon TNT 1-94 [Gossypium australe]|uniref:Retrovirus-related Pol polyprotein from transposon TNT 1-94 n=1 Tax=Gossypium australe TaxID=47621 RepID=A0A5B6WPV9_9ROSI|nr:Retrovirus-related Pol polyprotein from transposon TNT 1-94 [Gossypium australe]
MSIKKVPSKPRPDQPRAPLAIKGRRLGQISLEEMVQEENIHLAHTAEGSVIQKQTIGSNLMCNAKSKSRWAMLRKCAKTIDRRKVKKGWLIDSGCTNHMTPDATFFKNLDKSFNTRVKVGNGHYIKENGKGNILIDTPTGKQTRQPFPLNKAWRASEKLQLVHTDVCGPMKTQSLNGSRYFILFINDYSRFCWVYFLKHISKVASVFWKFKAAAETKSGCKLKTLRSDNGTEYTSAMFQGFCDEEGIKHQLTNTYTPHQNGVNKRKNRTLMDMARCLILPSKQAANQVLVSKKTPFEAWFGFKPSVAHLKVFGCICYAHIPAVKRDKLAKKAHPGILIGYSSDKNEPKSTTENLMIDQTEANCNDPKMDIDHELVKGTRPLSEIYERAKVATIEPTCFEEVEAQQGWKQAMLNEMSMIKKNHTWEFVARPANRKVIRVQWVFRAKHNADGTLNKLKVRLVVKGFSQKFGIDYFETFAPVARLDTIRLLVVLVAQKQWKIHQLDVKYAFLNGFLDEEIYFEQPEGEETVLIVSLYIDDLLVIGENKVMLTDFKDEMESMFEMSDLGEMSYSLGMEVSQT